MDYTPSADSMDQQPNEDLHNVGDLLLRAARYFPDHGIEYETNDVDGKLSVCSYSSLLEKALRILGGLHAWGIPPRSPIATLRFRGNTTRSWGPNMLMPSKKFFVQNLTVY